MLNSQQIAEVREFAETLSPFSGIRKEFSEAARLAEQELRQREAPEAFIQAQETRTHDPSVRPCVRQLDLAHFDHLIWPPLRGQKSLFSAFCSADGAEPCAALFAAR